jgi:hypothetical protein
MPLDRIDRGDEDESDVDIASSLLVCFASHVGDGAIRTGKRNVKKRP